MDESRSTSISWNPAADGELVTVARADNPLAADILCGCMRAAGIPAFVADSEAVRLNLLLPGAIGGVRVQVPERYAAQAQRVIADFERGALQLDDGDGADCGAA